VLPSRCIYIFLHFISKPPKARINLTNDFENQCFLFHSSTGSLLNLVYVDKTVKSKLMALDYYPRLENYRYIMTSFNILVKRSERESRSLNNRQFYCLGVQKIIRISLNPIYLLNTKSPVSRNKPLGNTPLEKKIAKNLKLFKGIILRTKISSPDHLYRGQIF